MGSVTVAPHSPEQLAFITDYLFVPEDLVAADMAIVFGMTRWHRPLERALTLYRAGSVRRLLFTGGYNRKIQAIEAREMACAARAAGVPASDIIVDLEATSTFENATNAARHVGTIDTALLVAIHYHARRVRLTTAQVFPAHIRLGLAIYPSLFYGAHDWPRSDRGRRDVFTELGKLSAYFPEDIAPLRERVGLPV